MRAAVFASLLACALASPLHAQTRVDVDSDDDRLSARGVGFVSVEHMTAQATFNAAFDDASLRFLGGGVLLTENGVFLEVTVSRAKKTGQRAFISNGQAYKLNIPLTTTVTPFELSSGYRFRRHTSIVPYAGVGIGSYGYSETSPFAAAGDDVSVRHVGFLALGGAEFKVHRLIGVSAEVQYTHIPGILGAAGLSQDAGENDLGGIAVRAKVIVGPRR
jgi:opacity protein-like surface antigen